METIVGWMTENWVELLAAVGSVVMAASAITALTPTPRDDKIVAKLYKIIEFLGGVVGKAKDSGPVKTKSKGK